MLCGRYGISAVTLLQQWLLWRREHHAVYFQRIPFCTFLSLSFRHHHRSLSPPPPDEPSHFVLHNILRCTAQLCVCVAGSGAQCQGKVIERPRALEEREAPGRRTDGRAQTHTDPKRGCCTVKAGQKEEIRDEHQKECVCSGLRIGKFVISTTHHYPHCPHLPFPPRAAAGHIASSSSFLPPCTCVYTF